MKRVWLLFALFAVALLAACVTLRPRPPEPRITWPSGTPAPVRRIFPVGTATPALRRGLVVEQDFGTVTPYPVIAGSHFEAYWSEYQASVGGTFDWAKLATRAAEVHAAGEDFYASISFATGNNGAPGNLLFVPTGVPLVTYHTTPAACADTMVDYASATWTSAYDAMVNGLSTALSTTVDGWFIGLGMNGETLPIMGNSGTCADNLWQFEQVVSCSAYQTWVVHALATWRAAFPNVPLFVNFHETIGAYATATPPGTGDVYASCSGSVYGDFSSAQWLQPYAAALNIGLRSHALQPASYDFIGYDYRAGLGKLEMVQTAAGGQGGGALSPGFLPGDYPTAEARGGVSNMVYAALAYDADVLTLWPQWLPILYAEPGVMYALTETIGTTAADSPAAWVVLRSAETQSIGGVGSLYLTSDVPGPYSHLLEPVNVTPTPVCIPSLYATATAAGGDPPPSICAVTATPATDAAKSRNYLSYPATSTLGLDVDNAWVYAAGVYSYTLTLDYFDAGSAPFYVDYIAGGVTQTWTITRTATGQWAQAAALLTNVSLADDLGGADLQMRTGASALGLHRVYLDVQGSAAPTPTPGPIATPTTVPWAVLPCADLAATVDGNLAEWTAGTPYTLTVTTAAQVLPATTPLTATLGGAFYCAHSGANLYLAGTITDTVVVSPTGSLANGDAARLTLDGWADGLYRYRLDDHDLLVGSDGQVRDFEIYPVAATAVTSATVSGWQFEASIPLATLDAATSAGTRIGLTWSIYDNTGGTTWAARLTGAKLAGVLE